MLARLLSIRTSDPTQRIRGRLLKSSALLIGTTVVLTTLPRVLGGSSLTPRLWFTTLAILVTCVLVFGLAHIGRVRSGAALLVGVVLLAVIATAPGAGSALTINFASYMIPLLLAGLLIGAHAALLVGGISLVSMAIISAQRDLLPSTGTISTLLLTGLNTGLVWLTIRTLERAAEQARRQTNTARQAEAELRQQQQALEAANHELRSANQQQAALLELVRDLETPAIPILDGVLALPLIGHLDTRRAAHLTEAALQAVHRERARVVIIDITGVSVVDSAVAQRIEQLAQAIRLLGARVMLTGMRAEVAQTIAAQGLDFSAVETAGRLQDGIARVLMEMSGPPPTEQRANGHVIAH
ncbi:STAS domain-containing protein [Kallotenue papyrolyticum]|uniref:STAS domain-containing protein n=1 Tax=Kallotenue papyrolyticum TaxID=1325125 RepID=UPI0004924D0F|nr:STAS domain-containing protein [Kallotenue papyrolyticum]